MKMSFYTYMRKMGKPQAVFLMLVLLATAPCLAGRTSSYFGMAFNPKGDWRCALATTGSDTLPKWRQWCPLVVSHVEMNRFAFANTDTLRARVKVANYSGRVMNSIEIFCQLRDGATPLATYTCGKGYLRTGLSDQGSISIPLAALRLLRSRKLTFYVSFLDDTGSELSGQGYNIYIRCGSIPMASPWSRSSRSEEHGRLRMASRGEKRFASRPASCLPCPVGGFCRPAAVLLCQSHC
ncbi:MAG: hypothetical protein MR709_05050 [Bacteroidales bacterium]|nr:hypothetical protein [Bacteroidales bacterium]MDY4706052.1 hypothetical protein [Prevotella sp.]MCI7654043.1 hypothetical protein [Bacteroidales bacterium]MDD7706516.1 hypothetical protein [Bacteroidales bacterium]MDY4952871.1 hypothetical protein [Prevotella sp.]